MKKDVTESHDADDCAAHKEQALRSAFCHAAAAGNTIVVEDLLDAGVDVNKCFNALECAAENGRVDTLQLLLPKYDNVLVYDRQ